MKEKLKLILLFIVIVGIIVASQTLSRYVESAKIAESEVQVVIDAGHGGEDPGKVGVNDVLEKDLNLQIAQKVKKHLEEAGISVAMTREDDIGFYEDGVANKKLADMQKRVALINETNPKVTVSIHQNSYTDSSVKGAQVFYHTGSKEGEAFALLMQEELRAIDEDNQRQIKGDSTYYMLKQTQVPTIIVECGFLSNYEEAEKLTREDYQNAVAQAISSGIIKWLDKSVE